MQAPARCPFFVEPIMTQSPREGHFVSKSDAVGFEFLTGFADRRKKLANIKKTYLYISVT